jgi:hypothetical protein
MRLPCLTAFMLLVVPCCLADDPGINPRGLTEIEGNSLRLVRSEREFRALLKADHVVLYFCPRCSVPAHRTLATIREWVEETQPRFGVYYVDYCFDKAPYARPWLKKEGLWTFTLAKRGSVLCLRRGKVVRAEMVTDPNNNLEIQRWADEAFGSRP